mmetsp:Transcript_22325/g.27722  ORF Transcript_22325/g.27722 Transcript_22325/m.27722 type:complete len:106 (-) Transcript_22325:114-431(-)
MTNLFVLHIHAMELYLMSPATNKDTLSKCQLALKKIWILISLSFFLHKDDYVRLDSWYFVGSDDPRIAPLPGGGHLNVMGYMYTVFTVEEEHSNNSSFATPISSS